MLKVLQCLFLISCVFVQSCSKQEFTQANPGSKPNLAKAASYNTQLGMAYLKQGDRPRAKQKLLTALVQAPDSPEVNAAIAYYFEQTNELQRSKNYYRKAITLSANSGSQLNNYGAFLCRQGEYKEAEQYFIKAVLDQNYVNTSGAYENAGLCSLAIPDYNKAKIYFTAALNQDPGRNESLYQLVRLESTLGHNAEAIKLIDKYPNLVSRDSRILALAKKMA